VVLLLQSSSNIAVSGIEDKYFNHFHVQGGYGGIRSLTQTVSSMTCLSWPLCGTHRAFYTAGVATISDSKQFIKCPPP